ncbi:PH domain-containing protein [Haloarchaeobius sp. DT45]|uniref:PH domain-containing protein n=1 Tax=Haloarchaeobius sp. DT45 TaxID=3446116 RepID=UPI003F6D4329
MARGAPRLVGALVGAPFVLTGSYVHLTDSPVPSTVGLTLALFGAAVVLTGLYVHRTSPTPIDFGTDERVIATVEPNQLVATLQLAVGAVVLLVAGYLLFATRVAFVYPTLVFTAGFAVLLTGLVQYWKNTLTTHYVTTQRIVSEYRFVSLSRQIIQIDDVIGITHTQGILESLVGYGSVLVSSGGGNPSASQITFNNVANPQEAVSALQNAQENYG